MPVALGEVRAGAAGGHDEGSPAAGEAWRLRTSGRRQRRASRGGRAGRRLRGRLGAVGRRGERRGGGGSSRSAEVNKRQVTEVNTAEGCAERGWREPRAAGPGDKGGERPPLARALGRRTAGGLARELDGGGIGGSCPGRPGPSKSLELPDGLASARSRRWAHALLVRSREMLPGRQKGKRVSGWSGSVCCGASCDRVTWLPGSVTPSEQPLNEIKRSRSRGCRSFFFFFFASVEKI